MSALKYDVTPCNKLEGTKASASQSIRRGHVIVSVCSAFCSSAAALRTGDPTSQTNGINAKKPNIQNRIWSFMRSRGSANTGYETSASKLPALLAAYRRNGDRPRRPSQLCNNGACVERAKNGNPTLKSSVF